MKKLKILLISLVSLIVLSACGGGGGNNPPDNLTTLFLVDQNGFSYGGIPYRCDSMRDWSVTAPNGEFTFLPPDNCEFDFLGLRGDLFGDPVVDDIVRIVDFDYNGKGGILYACESFGASSTYNDGSFNYDIDDQCVFYL